MEPADRFPALPMQIGSFIRFNLPSVVRIERGSFDDPWDQRAFLDAFRVGKISMFVAEHVHQGCGFILPTKRIRLR